MNAECRMCGNSVGFHSPGCVAAYVTRLEFDERDTDAAAIELRAAGFMSADDRLFVHPGRWRRGAIEHGVELRLTDKSAGFVVSFEDFERAYLAAKKVRESS